MNLRCNLLIRIILLLTYPVIISFLLMKQIISSHNQKILITHFGAIGDTIMCTPALKLLRENLPLSRVEFLTSNRLAYDVLKHNNEIDDVHYFQQYNIGNIKKRFKNTD